MINVYNKMITNEDKFRIAKLEIFDEMEEWVLLMSHYSLTIAIKGNNTNLIKLIDLLPDRKI
jgi:hypothetical protein